MLEYVVEELRKEQLKDGSGVPDDMDDWYIAEADETFRIWTKLYATDWAHLPFAGGIAYQTDGIFTDLLTYEWLHSVLMAHAKANIATKALQGHQQL